MRLTEVCRCCLKTAPVMTSFSPQNVQTAELIAMLSSVGKIEIEINTMLPSLLCKICEDKLRSSYEFQQLIRKSNEILKQSIAKDSPTPEQVIREIKAKLNEVVDCSQCNFTANSNRALAIHMSHTHKKLKPNWCSICNEIVENLTEHHEIHQERHKCKFCDKKFTLNSHLFEHLKTHSSGKPFKCHICKRAFMTQRYLDKHYRIHETEKEEEKKTVPKSEVFLSHSNQSRFRLHLRTHTGETPYKCQYCDKRMTSRNYLVIHERTHTGEKPYTCRTCGKSFTQSSVLRTHMRIHQGRPIGCEICSKRFCRAVELKMHMRRHTGEKPYRCDVCSQAFVQQSHLSEHLLRHSDDRPFKCDQCDKSFKKMQILKTHMTIHTGEKPFKCSQCPFASRQRHGLTQHMKQHPVDAPDLERPHFCGLCQKGYSTMAMLMSHNALVHENVK